MFMLKGYGVMVHNEPLQSGIQPRYRQVPKANNGWNGVDGAATGGGVVLVLGPHAQGAHCRDCEGHGQYTIT